MLFPYTTLFRSHACDAGGRVGKYEPGPGRSERDGQRDAWRKRGGDALIGIHHHGARSGSAAGPAPTLEVRSEEHTSELQSQSNIVCRPLLEKKKIRFMVPFAPGRTSEIVACSVAAELTKQLSQRVLV